MQLPSKVAKYAGYIGIDLALRLILVILATQKIRYVLAPPKIGVSKHKYLLPCWEYYVGKHTNISKILEYVRN